MDDIDIADQVGFILRGFTGEEAVEIFEAVAGGPVVKWSGCSGLFGGRVVPLAEGCGAVAVIFQHFGQHGAGLGLHAGVTVPVIGEFGDLPGAYAVMVSSGEQRRASGRAHRGGVEAVVGDAFVRDAAERRRVNLAAVGIGEAGADVID